MSSAPDHHYRKPETLGSYLGGLSVGSKATWSATYDGLRLDFWRGRWSKVFDAETFRRRTLFFKIAAGERLVAGGEFDEWGYATFILGASLNHFAQAADTVTQATYDMATALFSSFCRAEAKTGASPLDFGSIVLFDRLRIEATSADESKAVWTLINMIVRRFRRMSVAGLVLKAFPLEYEGEVTDANRVAFERRQRAMLRHYTRQLGVVTLPGWPGRKGWQWLSINCDLEPAASRRMPRIF